MVIVRYSPEHNYKTFLKFFSIRESKFIALTLFFIIIFTGNMVYAQDQLTELFNTRSFQGSWEVVNQFNWMGQALNFFISAVSVFGFVMMMWSKVSTFAYLSARSQFDTIHEYKKEDAGKSFLGFGSIAQNVFNGKRGVGGADSILGFFMSLMPDMKTHSEFNPERNYYNLSETDTVVTYILKTLVPTILMTFFLAISFSGTFAKAYGVVVGGMATAADRAVEINFSAQVNKWFSTGESYKFTIGQGGTEAAQLADKISKRIYSLVIQRLDIVETPARMQIGLNVENWAYENILGKGGDSVKHLESLLAKTDANKNATLLATDKDVASLLYTVTINTNNASYTGQKLKPVPITKFLEGTGATLAPGSIGDKLQIHVVITKGKQTDADFFVRPKTPSGPTTP